MRPHITRIQSEAKNSLWLITTTCPWCHKDADVKVPRLGFIAWERGQLIQNALPNLTPDQREQLITGICPKCWEQTFGETCES